jgi:hypothetical protein
MSKSKIVAVMALMAFVMSIFLVGDAVAGDKIKGRTVWVTTKWEQINVGDEKDHVVAAGELKGISSNMQGKSFGDGWLLWCGYVMDISSTIGANSNGYGTWTDKDGDKIYWKFDQKSSSPAIWTFYKGTGKFREVQGKGTSVWVVTAEPTLNYTEWEIEVELPR